jgi:hypothetical protein
MKENLAELLAACPNPDPSYVLDECALTPEERAQWEAKRSALNAALAAKYAETPEQHRAGMKAFDAVLSDQIRGHAPSGGKYDYPKSE